MVFRRRNRGFTLIEITISTMILCVASIAVAALLVYGLRAWSAGTSRDAATGSATFAMQRLSSDIRDGVSARVVSNVLIVTFPGRVTDGTTGETIYDSSGAGTTTRSYFVLNGNLVRRASDANSVIGRGVTRAVFGGSGGSVTATLTATEQTGTGAKDMTVTGRVSLRNFRS